MATKETGEEMIRKTTAMLNITNIFLKALKILDNIDNDDFVITIKMTVEAVTSEIVEKADDLNGNDKFIIMNMLAQISDYVSNC